MLLHVVFSQSICELATDTYTGRTTYADAYGISNFYTLEHGLRLSHQGSPINVLIGTNPSCNVVGEECICTYTDGSAWSCNYPRRGYISYRIGTTESTVFTIQNPPCIYYFTVTIQVIPTPSASPQFYMRTITDTAIDTGGGIQGDRGWTYMYLNDMNEIHPLSVYVPSEKIWKYPSSYCLIQPNYIHPNTDTGCSTPNAGYCVPRLIWTNSDIFAYHSYVIYFSASHTYYNPPISDGTTIHLRINEEEYLSYGPTAYSISNQIIEHANISTVDMTLYPGTGCDYDGTSYRIVIYGYAIYPSLSPTPSASESKTPSLSGTMSSSPSVSPSQTSSRTLSRTPSRTPSRTSSRTRTPTETPLAFATAWPTMTPTAEKSPSTTPKSMITMWPSPYTMSITPTEQFIKIPYSRNPSPLTPEQKEAIQRQIEIEKENMKATAMAGVAIGVAGVASGVAVISQLLQLRGQSGGGQSQENRQNGESEHNRRRPRRPSLGESSDSETESDAEPQLIILRISDTESITLTTDQFRTLYDSGFQFTND